VCLSGVTECQLCVCQMSQSVSCVFARCHRVSAVCLSGVTECQLCVCQMSQSVSCVFVRCHRVSAVCLSGVTECQLCVCQMSQSVSCVFPRCHGVFVRCHRVSAVCLPTVTVCLSGVTQCQLCVSQVSWCVCQVSQSVSCVFVQVSRCVLAQWPLRCIRSYECSGRGRFALETGSHAAHGAACYVLHTRAGHDGVLYDRIDSLVNEQASLHGVSKSVEFMRFSAIFCFTRA